jgi:hypothetical protein
MIDAETRQPKLVEYNTIATGLGPLSKKTRDVQMYLMEKY